MNQCLVKASTVEAKDTNSAFLRAVSLSMALSSLMTGMLVAFVVSESVFEMEDTYFTKAA